MMIDKHKSRAFPLNATVCACRNHQMLAVQIKYNPAFNPPNPYH